MKERVITHKTAKLAQKMGFNEPTKYHHTKYNSMKNFSLDQKCMKSTGEPNRYACNSDGPHFDEDEFYSAPTQSFLQTWIRKTYDIHVSIIKKKGIGYDGEVRMLNHNDDYILGFTKYQDDYDILFEFLLYEALKLIKL